MLPPWSRRFGQYLPHHPRRDLATGIGKNVVEPLAGAAAVRMERREMPSCPAHGRQEPTVALPMLRRLDLWSAQGTKGALQCRYQLRAERRIFVPRRIAYVDQVIDVLTEFDERG